MSKEESSGDGAQDGAGGGPNKDANADIYENHGAKKLVRLVTVMAYMFSVSFVAIVLSAYYLFLWEPPNPKLLRRPVHLASEPEVQFLMGDQPIVSDEGHDVYLPIVSRIAEVEDAGDNYSAARQHREKLNESLFLLRNTLVEFLQDRANATERFRWRPSKPLDRRAFEKRDQLTSTETSNATADKRSAKNMKHVFDDGATTPDSSTISGDDANGDASATSGNNSSSDFRRTDPRLIRDPAETQAGRRKHNTNVAADGTRKTTTPDEKALRIARSRYFQTHPSEEKHSSAGGTAANEEAGLGAARSEALKFQQLGDPASFDAAGLRNSSENSQTSGIIYSGRVDESPARLTNLLIASEDPRMEEMTAQLVTMANMRGLSAEATTERKEGKDLLTILMNSTFSSTSASPLSTRGSFKIDTSRENTETANTTRVKIN